MYTEHFGLTEKPFSISPDPRYLYLSQRHADALAHLIYGISESGGFIQLTGEVGTGKTTLIRSLLEQLPEHTDVALVLNPPLSTHEFLVAICQELTVEIAPRQTIKSLIDRLNARLLAAYASGRRVVLIVDEAQTLSAELLEQIRLLTNLETAKRKLLQIILIGQPELRALLDKPEMRQVAQRITGRYHLEPLSAQDTRIYVRHRMRVAGARNDVFSERAIRQLYRLSGGIPRLINVIADRALLAAYTLELHQIGPSLVRKAAQEVFGRAPARRWIWRTAFGLSLVAAGLVAILLWPGRPAFFSAGPTATSAPAMALQPATVGAAVALADIRAAGQSPTAAGTPEASPAASTDPFLSSAGLSPTTGSGYGTPGAARPARRPPQTESAARRAFGSSLAEFLSAYGDHTAESVAASTLLRLWDAEFSGSTLEACEQLQRSGLQCLSLSGSTISDLRRIDRPIVLLLNGGDGRTHHVVMSALDERHVELRAGDAVIRASIVELSRYWLGEHWFLWRPLTDVSESLRPGMQTERVSWLREALIELRGSTDDRAHAGGDLPRDPAFYDAILEGWVREYQLSRGLDVDGIVGVRTQIALQTDLGHRNGPTLAWMH